MYKYKRILLKISGESLKGTQTHGYDVQALNSVVEKIRIIVDSGIELALVVGAGNIWRGVMGASGGMDRVNADQMGMLATVMNAIALKNYLSMAGISTSIQSAVAMPPIVQGLNKESAIKAMESGEVVIFAAGTGAPFFTTDTTAVLRALETDCEAVFKATKVDGIYDSDPFKNPDAKRFSQLTFQDAMMRQLKVMDSTAFAMCADNDLPIVVFNFADEVSLKAILKGDTSGGTIVSKCESE